MRTPAVDLVSRIVSPVQSSVKFSVQIVNNDPDDAVDVCGLVWIMFWRTVVEHGVFIGIKGLTAYSKNIVEYLKQLISINLTREHLRPHDYIIATTDLILLLLD